MRGLHEQLGAVAAPNRVLMAPLTRARVHKTNVPMPIMADYPALDAA